MRSDAWAEMRGLAGLLAVLCVMHNSIPHQRTDRTYETHSALTQIRENVFRRCDVSNTALGVRRMGTYTLTRCLRASDAAQCVPSEAERAPIDGYGASGERVEEGGQAPQYDQDEREGHRRRKEARHRLTRVRWKLPTFFEVRNSILHGVERES